MRTSLSATSWPILLGVLNCMCLFLGIEFHPSKANFPSAVFAPDLMGFGSSAKPSSLVYEPKLWYQQVADFIREVVGEPCVLIGNSIGSQVKLISS